MKENEYKKTEYCLYNYKKIDDLIEKIKIDLIDRANVSVNTWLRGRNFKTTTNTVENQAIRIADSKKIQFLKHTQIIIKKYLKVFKERNPKRYKFLKMKYFENATAFEIQKELGYTIKQQKGITESVVSFFYRKFKKGVM